MIAHSNSPLGAADPGLQRVPVLMYHGVGTSSERWERRYFVSPARFKAHVGALRSMGLHPCSMREFSGWASGEAELPCNAVLLTFDDGYAGVFEHAFPILSQEGIPFAVFIVSSAVGRTDSWRRHTSPTAVLHPLMTRAQLVEMAGAGVEIGCHSRYHADLPTLSPEALDDEILGARRELEDTIGRKVDCFAYPYGRSTEPVRARVAAAGYVCAFTTQSGFNRRGIDPLRIRRIDVYGTDTESALVRKLRFGTNNGSALTTARYYAGRALARCGFSKTH